MSELKPCGHCGGTDIVTDIYVRDGRQVACKGCGVAVARFNPDANAKAIAAWNQRTPDMATRIRELEEALRWLERANDALCANRSRETYTRMLDVDKATPFLVDLDEARHNARALLTPREQQ